MATTTKKTTAKTAAKRVLVKNASAKKTAVKKTAVKKAPIKTPRSPWCDGLLEELGQLVGAANRVAAAAEKAANAAAAVADATLRAGQSAGGGGASPRPRSGIPQDVWIKGTVTGTASLQVHIEDGASSTLRLALKTAIEARQFRLSVFLPDQLTEAQINAIVNFFLAMDVDGANRLVAWCESCQSGG